MSNSQLVKFFLINFLLCSRVYGAHKEGTFMKVLEINPEYKECLQKWLSSEPIPVNIPYHTLEADKEILSKVIRYAPSQERLNIQKAFNRIELKKELRGVNAIRRITPSETGQHPITLKEVRKKILNKVNLYINVKNFTVTFIRSRKGLLLVH